MIHTRKTQVRVACRCGATAGCRACERVDSGLMLAFLTSLRHPDTASDYARVELLLKQTLASIARQSCRDFVVIVVGNRKPMFELAPNVLFIQVDFPPPPQPNDVLANLEGVKWDKGSKLAVGLLAARQYHPDYVMIVDADDFIHRDLAAFVHARPGQPGWVVDRGWRYSRARNVYQKQEDFSHSCGSAFIVPYRAYGVPDHLSVSATQEQLSAAFGERMTSVIGSHMQVAEWRAREGSPLTPIPFRSVVYHLDTGENHSGKTMGWFARPHDQRLQEEFGVSPSRNRWPTRWQAYGAPAIFAGLAWSIERIHRKARGTVARTRRLLTQP